jgi:hypothetical protein
MKIKTVLRKRKDHFKATIYKQFRRNWDIAPGDVIILKINGKELVRSVMEDFDFSLPKRMFKEANHGDQIELQIVDYAKKHQCTKRSKYTIKDNKLDIRHFIPKLTKYEQEIYIINRDNISSSVWYPVRGGVNHITLRHFVDIDKISELLGFYFGDGTTCESIRSFRLTNCEPSTLTHCLQLLDEMNINKTQFKIQVIYSTNREIDQQITDRCINFWSKTLKINKKQIVSVTKANAIQEGLLYGSARICFDNSAFVEIMLHGVLPSVIKTIKTPRSEADYKLLKGFLRGLFAAEGSVNLNKNGSVVKIGMAFDPHSTELDLYKILLKNIDVNLGKTKGNELYIYNYKNIKRLHNIDAFAMHRKRNRKFQKGFKTHKFTS